MVDIFDWNDLDNLSFDQDATLQNDLDSNTAGYSGIGDSWTGKFEYEFIGNAYSGTFDGQGHAIKDVISTGRSAFFDGVQFGTIKDLILEFQLTPVDDGFIGGLVGRIHSSSSVVKRCAVFGDIDGNDGNNLGLISGGTVTSATIEDCYAFGSMNNMNSREHVAGLTRVFGGQANNCYAFCEFNNVSNTPTFGAVDGGTNNYFSSTVAGFSTEASGETALTTNQMTGTDASNNMSFDFANLWKEQP